MRKISISDKLIIASFLLSIVIITIVASYSFVKAKQAILDRSFNQLTSIRVIKTNLIEKFFNSIDKDINLAKSSNEIKNISYNLNNYKSKQAFEIVNDSNLISKNSFINELAKERYNKILIIGKNKKIYSIKNKLNLNDTINYNSLWKNTINNGSTYISDYNISNTNNHYLTISSKITDSLNNVLGTIIFEISSNSIDSIMLNKSPSNGLGLSGESYLVGSDYLMRSSSRFQKQSILKTTVNTEAVKSSFNNLPGNKLIIDYRGVKVLSSFSKIKIPNLNWAILAEIDYNEVTIPIYKIRNEIIFISIFIFVIILLVVIILSRKITFPIKNLNQAAHEIGSGNLDVSINYNSNDEIGELSQTFNQMVKKLKSQTEELEIEKTKSLRSLYDGQESERQRLSRELHDSLGQLLIGLKLKYENCLNQSKINKNASADLSLLFDKTIEETRRISNNLMPAALSEFGLSTAIKNICNEISETANINIDYNIDGSSKMLNTEIKTYLFRIIQEALTNIIKHAKAKNAKITIKFYTEKVHINISDDGIGFNINEIKPANSNGLNNINDRVLLLSGFISLKSEKLKGTEIDIEIPLK